MSHEIKGARLLPAFCPCAAPPGEREIFNLLRDDPGAAGWTALHSLDLAEHVRQVQGEADFVILIPNEGIVVLEVKSHHLLRVDDRGWWLGNAATPETRGPFKQASEALHSIRGYLEQRNLTESVPMISAVVFSCVKFHIVSPEWHSWQVLDKQSLHSRPLSASLLGIVHSARKHFIAKGLSWLKRGVNAPADKMSTIARILRPRFEILASPETRRLTLDTNLLQCTEEQFGFLDLIASNDRTLVSGLAGTGKTTLALEAVRRKKAECPEAVVGLFCFNKFLGRKLERECSGLTPPMKVGSFHNWMTKFKGISHGSPETTPNYWNSTLPGLVLEKLTAPTIDGGILDLLVLDEAQDLFREPWLDIFDLLLKGGLRNGRWMFFGDFERQDLFAQGLFSKDKFIDSRVEHRCAQLSLSVNCRNTQEISTTLTLLAQLSPGYSKILRGDTRHFPKIIFYDIAGAQETAAIDILQNLLVEGFKPRDIVLLSPYRESLGCRLAVSGPWKGRLKEFSLDCSTTAYCTIHAFKGLEAAAVILTDIDHLDESLRLDLFYIGMSRALHRLALLCHIGVRETLKHAVL